MKIIQSILILGFVCEVLSQTSVAITCPFAHFRTQSGKCVQCLTKCSRCQNLEGNCQGCSQGYKLIFDASKCDSCEFGKLRCQDNGLMSCQRFYIPLNGMCLPICKDENCQNCQSIVATTCQGCKRGFRLNSQKRCIPQTNMLRINSGPRQLQQGISQKQIDERLKNLIGDFNPTPSPINTSGPAPILSQQQLFKQFNINPKELNITKGILGQNFSIPTIASGTFNPSVPSSATSTSFSSFSQNITSINVNSGSSTPISTSSVSNNQFITAGGATGGGSASFGSNTTAIGGGPTISNTFFNSSTSSSANTAGPNNNINPNVLVTPPVTIDDRVALDSNFNAVPVISQNINTFQSTSLPTLPSNVVSTLPIQPPNMFIPMTQPTNLVIPIIDNSGSSSSSSSSSSSGSGTSGSSSLNPSAGIAFNSGSSSSSGTTSSSSSSSSTIAVPIIANNNNGLIDGISIIQRNITITSNRTIIQNNTIPIIPVQPTQFIPIVEQPQIINIVSNSTTNTNNNNNNNNSNNSNNNNNNNGGIPAAPTIPFVPLAPANCKIGQYQNRQGFCSACSTRCLTCINSQVQCLQCNSNYVKLGWKCIYNQTIGFNVSLKVPPQRRTYALNEGINQFKSNFINYILPRQYSSQNISIISLTDLIYDQQRKLLNVTGIVQKTPKISLTDLRTNMTSNLNTASSTAFSNIWPAGFIYNGLLYYNSSNGVLSSVNGTTGPIPNQTIITNKTQDTTNNNNGPNLVAILIPSIVGGLCLISGIIAALWYCCCRKKTPPMIPTVVQPIVDTFRPMNPNMAINANIEQQGYFPPINNAPAVPTPPTVSIIEPAPITSAAISSEGRGTQQLIKRKLINGIVPNPNANANANVDGIVNGNFNGTYVSNTSIDRNITVNQYGQQQQQQGVPIFMNTSSNIIPAETYVNVQNNTIQQPIKQQIIRNISIQNAQTTTTVPQMGGYRQQPINVQVLGNNAYLTTSNQITKINNNIPMLQSTIGVVNAPRAVTTTSRYEKQQKQTFNNNQVIVSRDVKVVEHTRPGISPQINTYAYAYNTDANNNNNSNNNTNTGYFQPPINYNIGSNTNIGSRIGLNETYSPSSGAGYTGNAVKYSFNRDQNQITSQQVISNTNTLSPPRTEVYGTTTGVYEARY